jgi:hypothetical protein
MMLLELGLPGLVFLGLCIWLVRKAWRAARTEGDLEEEQLSGKLADELRAAKARAARASSGRPQLVAASPPEEPRDALDGADVRGANPDHVQLVLETVSMPSDRRVEVAWVRSGATHMVWCERHLDPAETARAMAREVICVARIQDGAIAERWRFE